MNRIGKLMVFGGGLTMLFFAFIQPVYSQDYSKIITEKYLRTQFVFTDNEKLKYSQCEKNSYFTCTYIWGTKSKKDAQRLKYKLKPGGDRLQITYAQAKNSKNFQAVLASYSDAEKVDGIAEEAVWSNKRSQLSFITDDRLIVHIHIADNGSVNQRENAISVANHILVNL